MGHAQDAVCQQKEKAIRYQTYLIEHSHTTYHNVKVPYLRTKSHSREVTVRYRTRDGTCQDHGQDQDRTETRDTPMSTTSKAYDGGRSA